MGVVSGSTGRWTSVFVPRPAARLRLFAFHFAGGGASVYRPWALQLPPWVELRAVQLPGRLDRRGERPLGSVAEVVAGVADAVAEEVWRPYAVFGHSMGALVAFELARLLRARGLPPPVRLSVSGWPSPRLWPGTFELSGLPDAQFVAAVTALGGIPEEVLRMPSLLRLVLPVLRADLRVCEEYRYAPEAPLTVPVSVFAGVDDPLIPKGGLETWTEETTCGVTIRRYPGHHFYLLDQMATVIEDLVGDLSADVAGDLSADVPADVAGDLAGSVAPQVP